jgi:hypothetical protein
VRRADDLITVVCWLSWNLEASTSSNPQGLSRPVMGLLYLDKYHDTKTQKYNFRFRERFANSWTFSRLRLKTPVIFTLSYFFSNYYQIFFNTWNNLVIYRYFLNSEYTEYNVFKYAFGHDIVQCSPDLEHLYRIYSNPTHDKHQWLLLQFTVLLMMDAKGIRNM